MANYRTVFRKHNERPYFCYFCGEECEEGKRFDVHHKDHNRKHNEAWNLRAAHRWCHVVYHSQVQYLYWHERFMLRWFDRLPKYVVIEPNSAREERWKKMKFDYRDPERLRMLARSLPVMRFIDPDDLTDSA